MNFPRYTHLRHSDVWWIRRNEAFCSYATLQVLLFVPVLLPTQTPFDEPVNSTGIKYLYCISADGLEVHIDTPIDGKITEQSHLHGVANPNTSGLFSIQ